MNAFSQLRAAAQLRTFSSCNQANPAVAFQPWNQPATIIEKNIPIQSEMINFNEESWEDILLENVEEEEDAATCPVM
jgi:hypothetical protein